MTIDEVGSRRSSIRTVRLAWGSLLVSKVVTFATQILAIPTAYRALGPDGFAAYAAVTAAANLVWALNLGIGGALVTPIAEAAARGDRRREAELVQAGLAPLVIISFCGAILAIPILCFLPLETLFGKAAATGLPGIRVAAVIAMTATLLTIPLSGIEALRQAYQEIHIGIAIGTVFNFVMCCGLLIAARFSTNLIVFVAVFVIPPLLTRIVSSWTLLRSRSYLLQCQDLSAVRALATSLLGDGVLYLASSYSGMLAYQWPIYWVTKHESTAISSAFAICTQIVLVPVSSIMGMIQPLWSPIADARTREDFGWLRKQLLKLSLTIVAIGSMVMLTLSIGGDFLGQLWVGRPLNLGWQLRTLMGLYVLLAIWESLYLTISFGMGYLRQGSLAVFMRTSVFAACVPFLSKLGGAEAIWFGLCCSILGWTSWKLPALAGIVRVGGKK